MKRFTPLRRGFLWGTGHGRLLIRMTHTIRCKRFWFGAVAGAILLSGTLAFAQTRWSGRFNYHDFQSSANYFYGLNNAQIDHICKTGDGAGTEAMEQCQHRDFERANNALNKEVAYVTETIIKDDKEYIVPSGQPAALPYFLKSQAAWSDFRDNSCYSGAYESGERSLKYIAFWYCMTQRTKARIEDLRNPPDE